MSKEIENKIRAVLREKYEVDSAEDKLCTTDDLSIVGINSVSFIKLIVSLEEELEIEFEDDMLDFTKLNTIRSLVGYIKDKLSKKLVEDSLF
ncbi:MAG: hypothetical protein FIA99_01740 [Ruminiclostridium sp.]|nr:hypothetical protein [Ruminiclostridium sp.]